MRWYLFLITILITLNLVNADIYLGNKTYEIKTSYSLGDNITGWINISLKNESGNSFITAFKSNMNLLEFLNENGFDCRSKENCFCEPQNCEPGYSIENEENPISEFTSLFGKEKLIGIKLEGQVSSIEEFSFNISSDVGDSCITPLQIDILDDEIIDWSQDKFIDSECSTDYGCYNEEDSTDESPLTTLGTVYCEKIDLKGRGFKIGAEISGNGNAQFKMIANTEEYIKECNIDVSEPGEISCEIIFDKEINEKADICLSIQSVQSGEYKIKYEDIAPCGYSGDYEHDFKIFAKPLKYSAIKSLELNESLNNLKEKIESFILRKYNGDCSKECIIPIVFKGIAQKINLNNLTFTYISDGIAKQENNFYEINKEDFYINSDFLKLDLEKANLKIPFDWNNESLVLKISETEILREEITLKESIKDIVPKIVPALVPVKFIALIEEGNYTYEWDFGDGTTKRTSENKVTHLYSNIGIYELKVSVNGIAKSVNIEVISPINLINKTLRDLNENLDKVESEINKLEPWIKNELIKKAKINELRAALNEQKIKYENGIDEQEAIEIMRVLLDLKVPKNFGAGFIISKSKFIQNSNRIDFEVLKELGTGDFNEDREKNLKAINAWISENLDTEIESKTYVLYFDEGEKDLLSHVKITLTPKKNIEKVYVVIDGNDVISEGFREIKGVFGKSFDINKKIIFEFLYPGKIFITDVPIYISPSTTNLKLITVSTCNNNGICEEGENYRNCKNDCKPWLSVIVMLSILFFIALIIYIFLQEWYKLYYEKNLFPNKNQLFNLVHFMYNSLNQGLDKRKIFNLLKNKGWNKEQLNYAWRKLHGKRTGMWEIPVFKWIENIRVKREIAKRGKVNPLHNV